MPRSDFSMLKLPMSRTKNCLKKNCLDFIAKEMWHLNSLEFWETVRDLSQVPPKPKTVAKLKEMLHVTAYSGSDRESCKSFQSDWRPVLL